jgi:hypothetical protein
MDGAIDVTSYMETEGEMYQNGFTEFQQIVEEYTSSRKLTRDDFSSRGRLLEAVLVREGARDLRRDIEHLDTGFLRRPPTSPRRRRFAHPGRRSDHYTPNYYLPDSYNRGRSPRSRNHHYSPTRSSFRRPSPNYVLQPPPAEFQLARAMADLDVKNEDREDKRDRGGRGGRGGGGNNRKRRYDGKLRACASTISDPQLTSYTQMMKTTTSTTVEMIAVDHLINAADTMTDHSSRVVATKSLLSRSFVACC